VKRPAIVLLTAMLLAGCQSTVRAPEPRLHVGVDRYHMPITTESPEAQRWFDQGLQFTYGFCHTEAVRSYREAARLDPDCAMAWWGVAYALGPNINAPIVDAKTHAEAYRAAREALARLEQASAREAALIRAIGRRYALSMPEDVTSLNEAFADAMREVHLRYPDDPDVATVFADSLMNLQPWDYWTNAGEAKKNTAEVVAVLEHAMSIAPDHPGANHLYIHAMESGPEPEKALVSAEALRHRVPGAGHLVHMPSHIYTVVGRYPEAADANEWAISADRGLLEDAAPDDAYWGYYGHDLHFLAYAAMMECRYDTAMRAARQLWRELPDPYIRKEGWFVEGIVPTKYHVMIRFGRWNEILAEPPPREHYIVSEAVHHYARSIAHSALGQVARARAELKAFEAAAERIPDHWLQLNNRISDILPVARAMVRGELLFREGRLNEAFAVLREGAGAEDALVYDEPPAWMVPVRHAMGALLMSAGRYAEAEQVYREDLKRNPNNGWGLLGLEQALRAQGKLDEIDELAARRATAWARADVHATSSCFCEPGRRTYR
jgi:tetratricopeptide (TPR) repeat protein